MADWIVVRLTNKIVSLRHLNSGDGNINETGVCGCIAGWYEARINVEPSCNRTNV